MLIVHDLLLNKRGIAAPTNHPLRIAVEKHKARLNAEFTRVRLRDGCENTQEFRKRIEETLKVEDGGDDHWHPRWVRVNTLKTSLQEQLHTTFKGRHQVDDLKELRASKDKAVFVDKHVPNLLALVAVDELTRSIAYLDGLIIFQDKASCFPALLLDPASCDGDIVDACAAPGNKTTHVASLMQGQTKKMIHACERDATRVQSLLKIVNLAGAAKCCKIHAGQDFLRVDPDKPPWNTVSAVLLDPSCSGSGIIGRDETIRIVLPKIVTSDASKSGRSRKRKRPQVEGGTEVTIAQEPQARADGDPPKGLSDRLEALSKIQLKLLLHAFNFPSARRITYSTCSIYDDENEHVVIKALKSVIAKRRRWRIMRQDEQPDGLREWPIRGKLEACEAASGDRIPDAKVIAKSCIRCEKSTMERTQGFFVAGFVRYDCGEEDADEFNGFDD